MSAQETRLGDQPGYFLSTRFWSDRYRDFVSGQLSTRVRPVRVAVAPEAHTDPALDGREVVIS